MNPTIMVTDDPRAHCTSTGAVQRLNEGARTNLTAHFLALPPEDRRLRFGAPLSAEAVAHYVDGIDFARDAVFGVVDEDLTLVGVAHVAFTDDFAELGISVLPWWRSRGVSPDPAFRGLRKTRTRAFRFPLRSRWRDLACGTSGRAPRWGRPCPWVAGRCPSRESSCSSIRPNN